MVVIPTSSSKIAILFCGRYTYLMTNALESFAIFRIVSILTTTKYRSTYNNKKAAE